jgi:outer membrane protein TolC
VAGAGYASRNNDSGGRSIGIEDRVESLRPSTSQERDRTLANLTFSWNALDFGVSYYRAQQKADQFLMAEERRRKVAQNVLQDVRNSYWRALGAQRLLGRVDALLARVNTALAQARQVEKDGLMPQPQVLAYQRALLDAVNLLTLRRQDLELARAELTALMSIPPGTAYTLADEKEVALPPTPRNLEDLETLALEKRPEILEESYRKRVTANDIKAAKLLLWPNLSVDAGPQYDSNKYNYNSNWVDVGVRLSWNVLKLAQLPALNRAEKSQAETDDLRRMALSMAVLTQVRVGVQRYELALSELKFAEESLGVDNRLLSFSQKAAKTQFDSRLEVIRAEARALLAEYQRYATYSNAQAAWGRVYNSVGLDVLPDTIASHDVKSLAKAMEATTNNWQSQVFKVGAARTGMGTN